MMKMRLLEENFKQKHMRGSLRKVKNETKEESNW